jgi:hypothetical protein
MTFRDKMILAGIQIMKKPQSGKKWLVIMDRIHAIILFPNDYKDAPQDCRN